MFHLQSLELVHWDYCQRVSLPLDASIITVAGPNGSGKTTLLDALRTLLGLRCSHPRDYKTYARHAGANVAWLRAVVDNRAQTRQMSSRPFAKQLLYSEQVTLACRIERNGGDWQRRYMLLEGDVSIEQLRETPEKELRTMGVEQWGRTLAGAGLSPAMARVLSLEQGQTDRLCEYSPRELLRLVFEVFGDQDVLNAYALAREHQALMTRELQQAEKELDHSKARLAELHNQLTNYLDWRARVQERERLATEVVPVLQWAQERQQLAAQASSLRQGRQRLSRVQAEQADSQKNLFDLHIQSQQAQAQQDTLAQQLAQARKQLDQARDVERPLEQALQREQELHKLADKGSDQAALLEHQQQLKTQKQAHDQQLQPLHQQRQHLEQALTELQGQHATPLPSEARDLRQQLQAQGIAHRFLAEVIDVRTETWRTAIEGVLRPVRWMVLIDRPDDLAVVDGLAERLRYRHYVALADTDFAKATAGKAQGLLAHMGVNAGFNLALPAWLLHQWQALRCVDNPAQGRAGQGSWITPQAYTFDGRGARSVWLPPKDQVLGQHALQARRDALSEQLRELDAQWLSLTQTNQSLQRQIDDVREALRGHTALQELARRSEEFDAARRDLPQVQQARLGAAYHWQTLESAHKQAIGSSQTASHQYQQAQKQTQERQRSLQDLQTDLRTQRQQLSAEGDQSQHRRRQFAPSWITPARLQNLVEQYANATQAKLRMQTVEAELERDQWQTDPTLEERHPRMQATVTEMEAGLGDHRAKNAQAEVAVLNARESYIGVLRGTVRRYRQNIQELGRLAGVEVQAELPTLENDDTVLAQAGLKVSFNFDGKGSIGLNDGEASGGQQVIKSLILLVGLLKEEEHQAGGFVFIDEPFAHLDVRNIQLVGHFLKSTQAQYVLTTPITHNLEVFEPAEITLVTSKKPTGSRWAPPIAVAKRRPAGSQTA